MLARYLLLGTFLSSLAAVLAVVFGASFWLAFSIFSMVGAATVILLACVWTYLGDDSNKISTAVMKAINLEIHQSNASNSKAHSQDEKHLTKILVVDDDPFILDIIPKITEEAGFFGVSPVASGIEALRLLGEPKMTFDCILLDINMPKMDGIELCHRVRQIPRYRNTPIIMLTAARDIENMSEAYRAGATDYATKPFVIDELSTRLRLALKTTHVQRTPGHNEGVGIDQDHSTALGSGLKTHDGRRLEVVKSLIDYVAFDNYLTQLPGSQADEIQIFALTIDNIQIDRMQKLSQEIVSLLQNVAEAVGDCLGPAQTLMTYTKDATLLIALHSTSLVPPVIIEKNVEKRLRNIAFNQRVRIGVSVGGPIKLPCNKVSHSRIATDHAIGLAKLRDEEKYGVTHLGQVKK